MKRHICRTGILLGIVVGWCATALGQAEPATTQPAAPRIEVSTEEWNFGEVWQGEKVTTDVTVKNVGNAPLEIEVKSSCGCTTPTKPKSPLAPGESDKMSISYDTLHRNGDAHQTVTLKTNDPQRSSVAVRVRGSVRPLFTMEPVQSLSFGRLYRDSQESRTIVIENKYTEPLMLKLKADQDFDSYDVQLVAKEEGRKYELTAVTKAPLPIGAARTTVVVETGLERVPELRVTVFGTVQPPIMVHPGRLYWPTNLVAPLEHRLRFQCTPGHPVKILSAKATIDAITVALADVKSEDAAPGACLQELIVNLPPGDQAPADVAVAIEITTDAEDPQYQKLVVPIRVVGPRPAQPTEAGKAPTEEGA